MSAVNHRATLKTVAEACGLAVTTVSRALNGHEDIASSTREKVQRIAADIGYVPNRQGQALRTGQSHLISLIVPSHAAIAGYTSSIIFSMGEVFREAGYELSAMPDYERRNDLQLIKSLVENRRADGIILTRLQPQDLRVRYLLEQGVPFVTHGRTELASPHAYVDFDNQRFTEVVTGKLIEQGFERLMLIGPPEELTYANHMNLGFRKALANAGLEAFETPEGISLETPLKLLRESTKQLLNSDNRPDGIVCGGELAALAVVGAIYDAGLTPAKDVAVTAKQTSSVLDHSYPPVDTCFEDIEVTGKLLAETMLELIGGASDVKTLNTLIQPQPIWRN